MFQPLKVAVLPYDIAWGDKEENLLSIGELIRRVDNDVDLVVLPELFTTGVLRDETMIINMAETNQDKTIRTLTRWASFYNIAICGSFLATTSDKYYNRAFFVEPSGEITFYDKHHLFSIGGESNLFSQGQDLPKIIRYRGWNIAMIICYDLRFPVWCRNVENKYDILISIANWPSSRSYAWRQLLIARALENQAYVVGANRSGSDDYGSYDICDSICINFKGELIGDIKSQIIYATFDKSELDSYKSKFSVWTDADKFELI